MKGPTGASGALFIAGAAFLWATDALVRLPSVGRLDPTAIVFSEHLIATAVMLPWVLGFRMKELFTPKGRQWAALALIGAGGSALATVLFTESFRYVNPSVSILLQKVQPILVVGIAYAVLGERPTRWFYPWAAVALAASFVLSFPGFDFGLGGGPGHALSASLRGALFALSAAALWAAATVAGRALLLELDVAVVSFWRFAFGLLALSSAQLLSGQGSPLLTSSANLLAGLVYMALFPGLSAMLLYYAGLARTPASVATFVELIFPLSAVVLNTFVLKLPLSNVQLGAAAVLLIAVSRLTSPADDTARS